MALTPLRVEDALTVAADRVARVSGTHWEEFLTAFAAFSLATKNDLVKAAPDKVLVAQGRAQQCDALYTLLSEAKSKAASLQPKRS